MQTCAWRFLPLNGIFLILAAGALLVAETATSDRSPSAPGPAGCPVVRQYLVAYRVIRGRWEPHQGCFMEMDLVSSVDYRMDLMRMSLWRSGRF